MKKGIKNVCIALAALLICCMGCQTKVSAAEQTSAEQFLYKYNSTYQGIELTKYQGKDAVVNIPEEINGVKVTAIGTECFYKKSKLTSVTMPDTIVSIGDQAFALCSALETVTWSKMLKHIGTEAFIMCKIRSFTMPDHLAEIGTDAFWGCNSLTDVVCSKELTELNGTFSKCGNLKTVRFSSPSKITKIGKDTFFHSSSLKEIEIPSSVTEISEDVFYLSGLEQITFAANSSLFKIGSEAFAFTNLKSIVLPDSLTELGKSAFSECKNLTDVTCSRNLAELDSTFYKCYKLKTVTFPPDSKLTRIGDEVFYDCMKLKQIQIPKSVKEIGVRAFYYCEKLKAVKIPASVIKIDEWAFYSAALNKLTFAKGSKLKEIGSEAFYMCAFETVKLPASLEKMGQFLFDDCYSLKKITFAKNSKVKKIPEYCFGNCYHLDEVEIPENVISIGNNLFKSSSYSVGEKKCNRISKIHIKGGKIKKIGKTAFDGLRSNAVIAVPKKYENKYKMLLQKQKFYKETMRIKAI